MAELKNTIVNGVLNVNGDAIASKIIKRGGTSSQILMADGSVVEKTAVGSITGVTAGKGLTGGGSSGTVTLNVGAGNGITVNDDTVAAKAGNGITVDGTGINHYTPSSVAKNITAANRTYVKSLTFDDYGHVTGYTTGTESDQDLSNYVTLNTAQTISGNKTFTGNVVTSNNKFEIKANSNNDDSWIKLTNKSDAGYYAFGIRRPYDTYGLQLKIHPAEGSDTYYDIWHAGNDGTGSGLDADLLDGKHASEFTLANDLPPDYVKIDISGNNGELTTAQLAALKANPHKTVLNWGGYYCFAENLSSPSTYYYSANCTFNGTTSIDKKVITLNTSSGAWSYSNYQYTNNTYSADRGISLVSGKFGHSNTTVTAQTTKGLYKISYDTYGHITGTESFTLPDVSGFVTGPSNSTDNAIARFNSTTGKLIQNSRATIDDTGNLKINNSDGGDIGLILGRGSNADWRLLGKDGNFYIQGNYTTSKQTSFYNVLTLAYNSGNATIKGSVTANGFKHSDSTTGTNDYVLLAGGGTKAVSDFQAAGDYLPKTTYEWNKEYAASANGAVSLGRYKLYDTQLTFDITTTTSTTLSGKLVIAAQNGKILKATVYGDASNTLVGYLTIYQSAIASDSTSWIEVFCNFPGWSKNKVHIYGVDLASATVTRQMASVTFTDGVPSGVTSGDTKWTGTIVNDIDARGFVAGPSESTDNAVVRFDGTTGKVVQNSGVTIDDNNKLKINANDTGGQSNVFQALSTSASVGEKKWIGRSLMGSKTLTFLMGTYNNMAAVGAHSWTDANASSGAAWAPMYFQPDGGATAAIYMGQNGSGWTANTGTLIVKGSGTADAGTVDVNGTFTATTIKKTGGADTHVLLAGGGTKALSDFSTSDTKVTQSNTTTANWRKVVLSYQDSSTAGTATTSHTNQVYVTPNIEVQPSTGNIRIAGSIYEGGTALSSKYAAKGHNHDGTYLKEEADTLQSVTNRGATTTKTVTALSYSVNSAVTMEYDSTYKALKFVFA